MERNFAMFFTIVSFYVEISFGEVISSHEVDHMPEQLPRRVSLSEYQPDDASIRIGRI
jgi:hypothetical protein